MFNIGFEQATYTVTENGEDVNVCISAFTGPSVVSADFSTLISINTLEGTAECKQANYQLLYSCIPLDFSTPFYFYRLLTHDLCLFSLNQNTAGVDYTLDATDVISILASSTVCVTVEVLDDTVPDGDKRLNLQLITNDQSADIVSNITSIIFVDNDGKN